MQSQTEKNQITYTYTGDLLKKIEALIILIFLYNRAFPSVKRSRYYFSFDEEQNSSMFLDKI